MKIVTTYLKPRYSGILNSIQNILGEVTLWESDRIPLFDFFYYTKPDLLLVDEQFVDSNFKEAISGINSKIILFGNSVPDELKVDIVCAEPSVSQLMKKHLELNNNVYYVRDYIDTINYIGGESDDRIKCDVGTIFSNSEMTIELLEFLLHISSECNFKIVGDNNITIPNLLGNLSHNRKLDFMKSCNIFLDINGTMLLEAAANGIFTFSTLPNKLFPNIDIENFKDKYDEFINDEDKRIEIAQKAKFEILNSSTNFHRLIEILELLDIDNKEEYINKAKEKITETLS